MSTNSNPVLVSADPRHLELARLLLGETSSATRAAFRLQLELAPERAFAGPIPEALPPPQADGPLRACVVDLGGAIRGRFLVILSPEASSALAALLPGEGPSASARLLAAALEASLAPRFVALGRKLGIRVNPEVPFHSATRPPPPNLALRFELRLRTGGRPAGLVHLVLGYKLVGELAALLAGASGLAEATPEAMFQALAAFTPGGAGTPAAASPRGGPGGARSGRLGNLGASPADFLGALPSTALQDYLRWLFAQGIGDEGLALLTTGLSNERREAAFAVFSPRVRTMVAAVDLGSPACQSRLPQLQARILELHTRTLGFGDLPETYVALRSVLTRFLQDSAREVLELLPLEQLAGRCLRRTEAETLIRELPHHDLVRALHGAPAGVVDGILGAVGRRGRELWKQDLLAYQRTGGPGGQPADPDSPEALQDRAAVALTLARCKEPWLAFERLLAGPRVRFGSLHMLRPEGEASPEPVDPEAQLVRELMVGWGPGRLRRPGGGCFREGLCSLAVEAVKLEERRRAATTGPKDGR